MKRRQFVFSAATFALLTGCGVLPNLGQPATSASRVPRVGILNGSSPNEVSARSIIAGLEQGLAQLGYVEGQTIMFRLHDWHSNPEPLVTLANGLVTHDLGVREFVQLPVDVIVSLLTGQTLNAQQATSVIPIVFVTVTDPVAQGIVASLDHPAGNITGVTNAPATAWGKQLEFLVQLVPRLSRVAVVTYVPNPGNALQLQGLLATANAMGVQLKPLNVFPDPLEDVEPALAEVLAWQAEALIISSATSAIPRFLEFQAQNRIPVTVNAKEQVQAGGLLSYGPSYAGMGRLAAGYVDKILKGAAPADLPVQQPIEFELVINQTTAQALGIIIPPEVAQQVTQWVQ
jgi:putative ABC transport system substrate-binding protein